MNLDREPSGPRILVVAVAAALVVAVLGGMTTLTWWYRSTILDEDVFVEHAVVVLASETGRRAIAAEIVDRVVGVEPLFGIVRGPAERAVAGVLAAEVFTPLFEAATREVHGAIVAGGPVVVDLGPWRSELLAPLAAVSEPLAAAIPDSVFAPIVVVDAGKLPRLPGAALLGAVGFVGLAAALVLVLGITWTAPRTGLVTLGAGVAGSGLVTMGIETRLESRAVGALPPGSRRELAAMLVDSLTAPLHAMARFELAAGVLVLVILGAVVLAGRWRDRESGSEETIPPV